MKRRPLFLLLLGVLGFAAVQADERPAFYPFDVVVAGKKALVVDAHPAGKNFAIVAEAVKADAELEVKAEGKPLIINIFPVGADGAVDQAKAAAATKVVMDQDGGPKVSLSNTMDGSKIGPGHYGLNIMIAGQTSRVMITVK